MIKGSFVILLLTYRKPHQLSVGFVVFYSTFDFSDFINLIDFHRLNDFYDFPTFDFDYDFRLSVCVRVGVRACVRNKDFNYNIIIQVK